MPVLGRTKKEVIQEFRTAEILEAARRVFARAGYNETTVDQIAEEAGVALSGDPGAPVQPDLLRKGLWAGLIAVLLWFGIFSFIHWSGLKMADLPSIFEEQIEAETRRYRQLMRTIDDTLAALEGEAKMEEKAMYRGFDPEKQAGYEKELVEKHGPAMQGHIDDAKKGMASWKQSDFDAMQAEADTILRDTLDCFEHGAIAEGTLTAFNIALEQFHNAVADRKPLLATLPQTPPRSNVQLRTGAL